MNQHVLDAAAAHFGQVLAQTTPDQYDLPTPCDEWTVSDLLDHVIGGNQWAALVLGGAKGTEALAQVRAMGFSGDRHADYAASVEAQRAAFAADGALDRTVDHLAGPRSGAQFLGMRIGDVLIHSWDLARAIKADERLPDELVQIGLKTFEPMSAHLGSAGVFGQGPDGAGEAATPQERLLHLTGRRP